ncbi:hypothetical protein GE107_15810 [Cohnella sp. CFH 77786]|uniref:hypothetical protein n=1 Tax=Cohnella sp. CFH 77786 TaxID=2662265 RepID=UPI001C60827C|nr:hypothetical protein [Cohnella sp. CFH 77786]MBW5447524.1 hypothetical protein [Cohnella sp. CFH 77786]
MKAWRTVLLLFAVSRVLILLILSVGQPEHAHYTDNQLQLEPALLDRFILYDSFNYAQIASEGYTEDRLTAFFPLFPLVVHGLSAVTGTDVYWAGFLLSNLFFIASLRLLERLMEKKGIPGKVRFFTLSLLAFFPSSYYFSAFYTESFFLFLALLAFRLWGDGKRGAAYFVGGLAALTRIVGIWIPLAFFLERGIRRKWDVKDFAGAFASGLMFSVYPVYLWVTKGDPLLFLKVQAASFGRYSTLPFYPVYQDVVWAVEKWKATGWVNPIAVFHLILFILFVWYLVSVLRSHLAGGSAASSEFIYTSGLVAMSLSSIVVRTMHVASHGFMRYILAVFPLFLFLGERWYLWLNRTDRSYLARRSVHYLILVVWLLFSALFLMILRNKGFVA